MTVHLDLVQVVLQLSKCKTLEQIVAVLRDSARDLSGADGVSIVLRDLDQCFYVDENAVGPLWKGRRFPMSACISGWCMLHREQVVISNIYADDRIPHDAYRPTFVKSLAMSPIRSCDPVGAIGAYWGTQHTATPEQLRTLQALGDSAAMALENSQLIEALKETSRRKDAFLTMLAHELRNPLAPIRNGLHLLKLQSTSQETVATATEMMERQVVHMSHIVDDLLDVARITNGKTILKKSRLDLATLLRRCVDDHRSEISIAGISLKLHVPLTPVWLEADATRLTQVFDNVIDNARKYTPGGGSIAITLHVDATTHQASVSVEDTGVGIAAEMLPIIFDTFMQADNSLDRTAGGLGLGLAVANGLVKLHNGTITVASGGIGAGARFVITLPDAHDEPVAAPPKHAKASAAGALRVLIIEDHKDAALSLQRLLRACGFVTSIANDGCAGVDLAKSERPDVILCDIGLPGKDGYTVATELRQYGETANIRMIAVTGYGSDEDRQKTRKAGFDAHLVKPIDLQELLKQLRPDSVKAGAKANVA